ncbi:GTPase-associated protein 1-related protein [Streptomyces sp. NPDC006645]|uniref:GTPase-associated protein 1-related protein n=1 Tax=unclassified Streptomyces TaxID=2593676 RepID=UPI0033A83CC6
MVIRRLSYLLDREPDTDSVRLQPLRPPGRTPSESSHGAGEVSYDLLAQVEQVIALTHRWTPHGVLSCSRLPAGGSLLCNGRADHEHPDAPRQFIDVVHLPAGAGGFDRVWPIDTWRSRSWGAPAPADGDELPAPEGHFDRPLLVRFAREQATRVAPFLADVRRLWADPAGRQIVIAEQDPETVAHWIALACASLPEHLARQLTFVTRADEPHEAPQQIIGIGPDSAFDRRDPLLVQHLYRVHDALGGPGSPALPDPWAELTAALWQAGTPPVPLASAVPSSGTTEAADPFDLAALVPPLLRLGTEPGERLTTLHSDSLRTVVATLASAAQDQTQGAPAIEELTRVCQELAKHCSEHVTDPLALVLARRRLAAALDHDTKLKQDPLVGLPLGEAAQRSLRAEFGSRFDEGLGRRLRGPVANWAGPLHLALVLHGHQGAGVQDAVDKLVRALLHPYGSECADAVAVLNGVGHQGLNRLVLEKLAARTAGRRSDLLKDLLMSPQGDWVRSHLKAAPPSVALVDLAVRWGGPPHHLRGIDLFTKLAEPAPGAASSGVGDPPTLETLWWLVWGSGQPERAHFPRIVRLCGAEAILAAGLGTRFLPWLTSPGRFDRELVDFAHAVHRRAGLVGRERATAQLLVLADDFARTSGAPRDVVDRVGELRRAARPADEVWDRVQYMLARGFAGLTPLDLYQSGALSYLANAEPALQRHYRAAVQAEYADDAHVGRMAARPDTVADLFFVWRRELTTSSREWHATVEELLRGTLGVVLRRMNGEQREAVANRLLGRSQSWLQTWLRWANDTAAGSGGRDTQIPGAPATYPAGHGQPAPAPHAPGQPAPAPHVPGQPPPPKPGELPAIPERYPPGYSPSHPPPHSKH